MLLMERAELRGCKGMVLHFTDQVAEFSEDPWKWKVS
jgi:hypothetical protein